MEMSKNPVIQCVIHHRQNPLKSTINPVFSKSTENGKLKKGRKYLIAVRVDVKGMCRLVGLHV
jgi:hypothetical protein